MKTLLRGGYVVSGRGCRRADVLIDGEKVEMLGHIPPELAAQSEVVDVTGCMLFPGFIDAHTHFDLDVCSTTTADDFESGSKSAIRGGTTTVIDFACPNKGESLAYGLNLWHKKADGKCYCDYGFHMTIDDWNESIESELDAMFDAGITSFKMYLTYPAMMIGDGAVYSALKALKKRGGIAGVHCENAGVIDARIAESVHEFGASPMLSGRGSYLASVAVNFLFHKIGRRWRVTLDDEVIEDTFALVSMCNGRYYGGGSTPVPEARMTDGVLHTVLVKNVSKARFATLFGGYSAGDYKKLPQDIIRVSTAKLVRIEALEGDLTTCLDGESMHSQCVTLKLADKKVNFFAPKGCDPDATAR